MTNYLKILMIGASAAGVIATAALPDDGARAERLGASSAAPPLPGLKPGRGVASGGSADVAPDPGVATGSLATMTLPSVRGPVQVPHESVISQVVLTAANGPAALAASAGKAGEAAATGNPGGFKVEMGEIDDLKSVYATVRSTDRIEARVRTGGTITALKVDEGSEVETGQVLATVADQKFALKLKSLDAQIDGLKSQAENARRDLDRQEELIKRGFTPKAKVDELRTQFEVVTNQVKSAEAERDVVNRQVQEGEVLAPASGRVLKVPVTVGSVVMPGESLATIAANQYVLRMELPERHARFIKKGDSVQVGPRTMTDGDKPLIKGAIAQVYPELQAGQVIADASVTGLGDYFVGERVLVYISAGKRRGMVIPRDYVATRYGYDFVKVRRADGATDVVVQLGPAAALGNGNPGVEVLGGLNPGDEILVP